MRAPGLQVVWQPHWRTSALSEKPRTVLHVDTTKVDTILRHLGIDSVNTQDIISAEIASYLASKRIEASIIGIRWNTVILSANTRNAELLKWEQDNLSLRVSSLVGADYKLKVRVIR